MKKRLLTLTLILASVFGAFAASPKYIFYFIGDGMGLGAVSLTDTYRRMVIGDSIPLTMLQMPVTSFASTWSASSPVTDSAAAGTALATGHKTRNGMLGVTSDSIPVVSLAEILHDKGYGIGLVTSVAPDDATPGAFYAHQPARGMFYEIGCDFAESGFEFLGGAGLRGRKDSDGNPTDLFERLQKSGVRIVHGPDSVALVNDRRVLMLGEIVESDNAIGYAIDSLAGGMTLRQMTRAGLGHMMRVSPDRFFMMVEGGAIDHAAHANDAATVVIETLAFDEALREAVNFMNAHPDETLIVVTADHETGGLILANRTLHYNIEPRFLQYPKISKEAFSDYCRSLLKSRMVLTWEDMKNILSDRLGLYVQLPVNDNEDAQLQEMFTAMLENRSAADEQSLYKSFNAFSVAVYDLINRVSGAGWTTGDHSGTPVPVFASGVGAGRFVGMKDNTDLPEIILSIVEEGNK